MLSLQNATRYHHDIDKKPKQHFECSVLYALVSYPFYSAYQQCQQEADGPALMEYFSLFYRHCLSAKQNGIGFDEAQGILRDGSSSSR